jgi:hypothetical protein
MQMTKTNKVLLFSSLLMILIGAGIVLYKNNTGIFSSRLNEPQLIAVQQNQGWGYKIVLGKRVLILQQTIPAVSGNKPFLTEAEALRTGNLVLEKIKKGIIPSLKQQELDSLQIHY